MKAPEASYLDYLEQIRKRDACECGEMMERVSSINTGASNEEGSYLETLYQCPKCKAIRVQ